MDEGQPVFQGDFLAAHQLHVAGLGHGAGIDAGIGGEHHAAHPAHEADAGHQRTAGHRRLRVGVVHAEARQRGQRQERRARVEQAADALARQQRATPGKGGPRALGRGHGALLQAVQAVNQCLHAGALAGEGVGGRVNAGFDGDHGGCLWFRDGWIANHGAPRDNRNRSDCA
ncbi:hypothetical protein D9M72_437420 [compost metagenome]